MMLGNLFLTCYRCQGSLWSTVPLDLRLLDSSGFKAAVAQLRSIIYRMVTCSRWAKSGRCGSATELASTPGRKLRGLLREINVNVNDCYC